MESINTYLRDIQIDSPIIISSLVTTGTKIAQVQLDGKTIDIYSSGLSGDLSGKVDKFTDAVDLNLDNYTLGEYLLKLANRLSGGDEV